MATRTGNRVADPIVEEKEDPTTPADSDLVDKDPPGDDSRRPPRRINVAVTSDMVEAIRLVMDKEDITLTEAVRRLLKYGEFIYRSIAVDGSEVLVRNGESTKEVVLL